MYEVRCSFCGRCEHHELRMVYGPKSINICERCVHEAQDALDARQRELDERQQRQDLTAEEQAEQAGLVTARTAQLEELQNRLTADRRTLRDREAALAKAEQTLTSLQEQLRRRSEELSERQKALADQEQKLRAKLRLPHGLIERANAGASSTLHSRRGTGRRAQTSARVRKQSEKGARA